MIPKLEDVARMTRAEMVRTYNDLAPIVAGKGETWCRVHRFESNDAGRRRVSALIAILNDRAQPKSRIVTARKPKRVSATVSRAPQPIPEQRIVLSLPLTPTRPGTVRKLIEDLIFDHKLTDDQIHDEVVRQFPDNAKHASIQWYRADMRRKGFDAPGRVG